MKNVYLWNLPRNADVGEPYQDPDVRLAALSLLILVAGCWSNGTPGSSQKQPFVALPEAGGAGGSGSQSDASASGPIQAVCLKSDMTGCPASNPIGYVCTDVSADGGGAAPDGVPALSIEVVEAHCTSAGVSGYPGQNVGCCTDLGAEFAY